MNSSNQSYTQSQQKNRLDGNYRFGQVSIGNVLSVRESENDQKPLVSPDRADKLSNGNAAFPFHQQIKESTHGSGNSNVDLGKHRLPPTPQAHVNNGSELMNEERIDESCYDGYKGINALRNNEKDKANKENVVTTSYKDEDQLIPGENEHKENHQEQNIKKSIEIKNGIPTRKWTNSQNANAISLANYQVSIFSRLLEIAKSDFN